MKKRIYIIDDEPDMAKIATDLLEPEGFTVNSFHHPDAGLKALRHSPPDLLLLDVRLPDKDGYQVLREIKSDPKLKGLSIVMVSVKSDEADVVVGLEMGADDYISKPFRRRELIARVKTVLRRQELVPEDQKVEVGPIRVDYASYTATVNKKALELTPKEFELLGFFLQREGRVTSRAAISEAVWGMMYTGSTRTIDVHVDTLRRKLGKYGSWIQSLKGVGYRFEADE